jgi:hypothetical protein
MFLQKELGTAEIVDCSCLYDRRYDQRGIGRQLMWALLIDATTAMIGGM